MADKIRTTPWIKEGQGCLVMLTVAEDGTRKLGWAPHNKLYRVHQVRKNGKLVLKPVKKLKDEIEGRP